MKNKFSYLILFFIFFVSLWFFSNTGYMLFPIFIVLFSVLVLTHAILIKRLPSANGIMIYLGVLVFYLMISLLHLSILADTYFVDDLASDFIRFFMFFTLFYIFYDFLESEKYRYLVLNSLSLVVIIFLTTFFIQVFLLYSKGYHLDYLELIMGREQRITGTAGVKGIYRPSGMFNEPGSFTVFMYAVLFARYLLNKKFDLLFVLGIFATLVTLSAQAIASFFLLISLFAIVYFFDVLTSLKIKKNILYFFVLVILVFFSFIIYFIEYVILFIDYFVNRFSSASGDGTVSIRFFALHNVSEQSALTIVFGIGFNNSGLGYLINDTGFWFSSYSMFGLPAFIVLIYFSYLVYKNHGPYALVMYFLIMLSKLVVLYPIMALYFAAVLSKSPRKPLRTKFS